MDARFGGLVGIPDTIKQGSEGLHHPRLFAQTSTTVDGAQPRAAGGGAAELARTTSSGSTETAVTADLPPRGGSI